MMDWRQLEYFRTVARSGHVTRAAAELGMTQPALSRAVDRLERELGVPLFERAGRSIRLTHYGETFLPRVERALDELATGRQELADMAGAEHGTIVLGFLRTLATRYVPELVRSFARKRPTVRFRFVQTNAAGLDRQLAGGGVHLALTTGPAPGSSVRWVRVTTQRLILIVPPDHRLAGAASARLAEVAGDTFISFPRGHAIRDLTDELCRRTGFTPEIAFEGDESSSVRGFVGAGFGVAVVPDTGGADDLPALHITEPPAEREIGLAWVPGRYLSRAEREFAAFVAGTDPL